jgi:hypothetical protein
MHALRRFRAPYRAGTIRAMSFELQSLVPFAVVAILILLVYLDWRARKARMAAWAEFASNHDMQARGFRVEGSYEGYPLVIEVERRGHGKHRYTVTALSLSIPDALSHEFSLEREGLGDKVLQFFGKRDEEIGDADFDKRFELKHLSPEVTAVLRHRVVQEHLYEMGNHYKDFRIRDGRIHAEHRRVPATAEQLEEFIGPALMLAHTLEETSRRTQRGTAR